MIVDEKIEVNSKSSDLEKLQQILSYKEKYSPEELKSIISFFIHNISNPYITGLVQSEAFQKHHY